MMLRAQIMCELWRYAVEHFALFTLYNGVHITSISRTVSRKFLLSEFLTSYPWRNIFRNHRLSVLFRCQALKVLSECLFLCQGLCALCTSSPLLCPKRGSGLVQMMESQQENPISALEIPLYHKTPWWLHEKFTNFVFLLSYLSPAVCVCVWVCVCMWLQGCSSKGAPTPQAWF